MAAVSPAEVVAQAQGQAGEIYTCTDAKGRRLTSDRPILECNDRDQRVLNRDGSLKTVRPPTQTAEERAEVEARERRAQEARLALAEQVRRDRNLMQRYRDEAAHRKARDDALANIRDASARTWARFDQLVKERKPLKDEAEFYAKGPLPPALKAQIESNEASLAAVNEAARVQQSEMNRINRQFDAELERLRKLWAGAAPGSLGPLVVAPAPADETQATPVRPTR